MITKKRRRRVYSTRDEEIYHAIQRVLRKSETELSSEQIVLRVNSRRMYTFRTWEIRRQLRHPEFELTDAGWRLPRRRRLF